MVGTLLAFGVAPDLALSAGARLPHGRDLDPRAARPRSRWPRCGRGSAAVEPRGRDGAGGCGGRRGRPRLRARRHGARPGRGRPPAPADRARHALPGLSRAGSGHVNLVGLHPPSDRASSCTSDCPSAVGSVAAARRAVRRFAGDLGVDLHGVELAVSEAVSNAVAHGSGAIGPARVRDPVRAHPGRPRPRRRILRGRAGERRLRPRDHAPARPARRARRHRRGRHRHAALPARRPLGRAVSGRVEPARARRGRRTAARRA